MKNIQVMEAVETLSQLSQTSDKAHPELIPQPERIKKAFSTLSAYLNQLYRHHQMLLKNHDYLASLKAVMVIAEEAHNKLPLVSKIFNVLQEDLGEQEFLDLFDFYLKKINAKIEQVAGEVFRQAEEERVRAETDTHGIRNLDVIRKDSDYELFYIKDEEGLNHFSKNLLRHAQLLGTFDELFTSFQGEDPFIKLHYIDDRMMQKRALAIRSEMAPRIDYFFKEGFRFKKQPFVALSCHLIYALFLASYPALVLQNEPEKACFEYFNDLERFLVQLITRPEFFRKNYNLEQTSDKGLAAAERMVSGIIASYYFSKNGSIDLAEHLYQFVPRLTLEGFSPFSFFDRLLDYDRLLRGYLLGFPSGPLMKALDFIREEQKVNEFAPLRNLLPQQLYTLQINEKPLTQMALGSPTMQKSIAFAEIDPLFMPLLDQLQGQKSLLIDLEDFHDPHAKARLKAVLEIEKEGLEIVNIPRKGLYYSQGDVYSFYDSSEEFVSVLMEQLDPEGAYVRSGLIKRDFKAMAAFVHTHFFEGKPSLTLRERLNFIELFHLFMIVKLIEEKNPDNLMIVCKDGIDHANAVSLSLYALVALVNSENLLNAQTFDFFIGELYGPAMIKRNRPVFEESLVRMYGALSLLYAHIHRDFGLIKKIHDFFPLLKILQIKKVN